MKYIYLYYNYTTKTWIVQENEIPHEKLVEDIVMHGEGPVSQRALAELDRSPLIESEGNGQYKGDWTLAILFGLTALSEVPVSEDLGTNLTLDFPWDNSMCNHRIDEIFRPGRIYSEFDILAAMTLWYQSQEYDISCRKYDILTYYQLSKVTWCGLTCYLVLDVKKDENI